MIYTVFFKSNNEYKHEQVQIGDYEKGNKDLIAINTILNYCNMENIQIDEIIKVYRNKNLEMLDKLRNLK